MAEKLGIVPLKLGSPLPAGGPVNLVLPAEVLLQPGGRGLAGDLGQLDLFRLAEDLLPDRLLFLLPLPLPLQVLGAIFLLGPQIAHHHFVKRAHRLPEANRPGELGIEEDRRPREIGREQ
jgi:hypothetical protein